VLGPNYVVLGSSLPKRDGGDVLWGQLARSTIRYILDCTEGFAKAACKMAVIHYRQLLGKPGRGASNEKNVRTKFAWRIYQNRVHDVFVKLGCKVETEKLVSGVRAKHKIDVWGDEEGFLSMLGRLEMVSMALERSRLGERFPVFLGVRVTVRILAHNFEELFAECTRILAEIDSWLTTQETAIEKAKQQGWKPEPAW